MIRQAPGNVVEPGSTKMVPGEGMPRYRSPFEKGELFIKFDVEFPSSHFADESTIMASLFFKNCVHFLSNYLFILKKCLGDRETFTWTAVNHSTLWGARRGG